MTIVLADEDRALDAVLDEVVEDPEQRYDLRHLARRMGIELGQIGGHQPGQPESGLRLLAALIGVSYSTAQRYQRHGMTWSQADDAAAHVQLLPRVVWPEWLTNAPGEEDLADQPCRCRPCKRVPIGGWCDRCGGRLR